MRTRTTVAGSTKGNFIIQLPRLPDHGGIDALGRMGNPDVDTPHLERMAQRGVRGARGG
ncbi:MAG: hypothetical protein O3A51_04450 [Verrucomicrobia bacterium]|nr:hypothetical protein [Verrucomicrobiota bacterium]